MSALTRQRSVVIALFTMWCAVMAVFTLVPVADAQAAPQAPISCTIVRTGGSATMTWTAASNDGADRYIIERNRNNLGWGWSGRVDVGQPLTFTNDTFSSADTVEFRVKAKDGNVNSATTPCIGGGGGLLAPLSCSLVRTGGSATMTWTVASNDGADRYIIERNRNNLGWGWSGRVDVGQPLTFTNSSFSSADTVEFRVKAKDGNVNSATVPCIGGGGGLLAPLSCSLTRTGGSATMTWTVAPNDGADRYIIERNRNNLGWGWSGRVDVGQPLTFTNSSFSSADTVEFRVKAKDGNVSSATVPCTEGPSGGDLLPPVSCTFTRSGDTATITWLAAANDGADRYVVDRNRNNLGWNWADRIDVGEPLVSTNTVAAADTVEFRVKSRFESETSATVPCTETNPPAGWVTRAAWELNDANGAATVEERKGNATGEIGFSAGPEDDGDVIRDGSAYTFNGARNSIVIAPIDADASDLLNPGGGEFRWTAAIQLPQSSLDLLQQQWDDGAADPNDNIGGPSWNVMQRGFANNTGGQWKTQIIHNGTKAVAECIVRDGIRNAGNNQIQFISAKSTLAIAPDTTHTITCEFNDSTNELLITVNQTQNGPATLSQDRFPGATFGDVDVDGSNTCGGTQGLGNVITFGSKPECSTNPPDPTDSFVGTIRRVAVSQR